MGRRAPVALLLAFHLCSIQVYAEDEPQTISSEGLANEQGLPSLDGSAAELPLSTAAPGTLTLGNAVNRSVN